MVHGRNGSLGQLAHAPLRTSRTLRRSSHRGAHDSWRRLWFGPKAFRFRVNGWRTITRTTKMAGSGAKMECRKTLGHLAVHYRSAEHGPAVTKLLDMLGFKRLPAPKGY